MAYPVPYYSPDQPIRVQAALWHPKENALVYVRQNDIFYIADVTVDQSERLTTDGSFNEIYNGIPDWTYQGIRSFFEIHMHYCNLLFIQIPNINRHNEKSSAIFFGRRKSFVFYYIQRYSSTRDPA